MIKSYKDFEKERREKNIEDILSRLGKGELDQKIETFIKNSNGRFTKEEVVKKIKEDEMFRVNFAVDPKRQNISEEYTNYVLENIKEISWFDKLPSSGKRSLFINNGNVISGEKIGSKGEVKTIDYIIKIINSDKVIYATQKRIEGQGGAQDHSINEIIQYLKNARDNKEDDVKFLALIDGDAFDKKKKEISYYLKEGKTYIAGVDDIKNLRKVLKSMI